MAGSPAARHYVLKLMVEERDSNSTVTDWFTSCAIQDGIFDTVKSTVRPNHGANHVLPVQTTLGSILIVIHRAV
jgi:hypothetical protein